MQSKGVILVWGVLDFLLLAAGGSLIAFSIVFKAPDAIRNLVLNSSDLNCEQLLATVIGRTVSNIPW